MTLKTHLVLLGVLVTLLTGVCPLTPKVVYLRVGEMAALHCPRYTGYGVDDDAKVVWTRYTTEEMDETNNLSTAAEQRQMGVLVHGSSLVILRASVNHQGNYSCSLGNASSQLWFRLIVWSKENEETLQYTSICYTQESCTLNCPDVNIPSVNTPNITSDGITWHKEGESAQLNGYFSSVEEKDKGVYVCTRSYLYHGQIYNMTFTVVLDVQPSKKSGQAGILSPHQNDVFLVDLGSTVVIDCKAVVYSALDDVFWLDEDSFVETDSSLPVFFNYTQENNAEEKKLTASLVFRKVSEEDLSKKYTCKLESVQQTSSFVTITLTHNEPSHPQIYKAPPLALSLSLGIVGIVVVIIATAIVYAKSKIDIALFLRDTLGYYRRTSDGKSYDLYLMCYKSDTDAGLNEDDREWLESCLEERFGYRLCRYDRDALADKVAAEAVLDCIDQSSTVVLVPTSSVPGPESDLVNGIHAALMERQPRLVFIKTGSLPEALQRLSEAGHCVTWEGRSSMPPSSSFWKQLRYYLPASRPLPRTATQDRHLYI